MDAMYQTEYDLLHGIYQVGTLSAEWHEIAYESGQRAASRTKVTIRLDADVVTFFRALGPGCMIAPHKCGCAAAPQTIPVAICDLQRTNTSEKILLIIQSGSCCLILLKQFF